MQFKKPPRLGNCVFAVNAGQKESIFRTFQKVGPLQATERANARAGAANSTNQCHEGWASSVADSDFLKEITYGFLGAIS